MELPGIVERRRENAPLPSETPRHLATRLLALVVPAAIVAGIWGGDLIALAAGEDFRGAEDALRPALALLPLAPLLALANQVTALRLRPEARLRATGARLVAFWSSPGRRCRPAVRRVPTAAVLAGATVTLAATPFTLSAHVRPRAGGGGVRDRGARGGR